LPIHHARSRPPSVSSSLIPLLHTQQIFHLVSTLADYEVTETDLLMSDSKAAIWIDLKASGLGQGWGAQLGSGGGF